MEVMVANGNKMVTESVCNALKGYDMILGLDCFTGLSPMTVDWGKCVEKVPIGHPVRDEAYFCVQSGNGVEWIYPKKRRPGIHDPKI